MVFSSLLFILYFLPITIAFYYLFPKHRNIILLISSLIFYSFGEPIYIVMLIFSSTLDYILSKKIYKSNNPKKYLILSIILNLGLLGFFKYADFIINSINVIFNTSFALLKVPLPIGISFYTFQTLSYTIDVYLKKVKPNNSYKDYMMYVSMFPQLIAGPIVQYKDVDKQIKKRTHSYTKVEEGIKRFVIGLSKKVLIADQMALINVTILNSSETTLGYWIATIAYGLQIYYDFSGYSDMAIGLGKMFGFDFLENFNYPHIAKSVSEFWRRWHISLGNWFKEYVYFPLGGSRASKVKTIRNLFIVWSLTGLWHGANWNFILWGVYFGIFIIIERLLGKRFDKVPNLIKHIYLLIVVTISWVLFAIEDINVQIQTIKGLMGIDIPLLSKELLFYIRQYASVLIIGVIFTMPIKFKFNDKIMNVLYVILFITTLAYITDSSFSPFIYFRF